ncbi:MAG: integrase core domain-containing protein [Actinomycetota bacterium]|nr:integrase core domain-containing protein [Actinomycetota bacterium]
MELHLQRHEAEVPSSQADYNQVVLRSALTARPRRASARADRSQGEGARIVRSPVRAPNANAIAERTVRSECTDRLLILNECHLRRVLDRYLRQYNEHRPHRGLVMHVPCPRGNAASSTPARTTRIRRHEVLGGLINEYHAA